MKASLLVMFLALLATGCSDIESLSSTETVDSTEVTAYANASVSAAGLLSAFYGLDDAIPFLASYRICGEFGRKDGMPVIFATEVDTASVKAGGFSVELADSQKVEDLNTFTSITVSQ